MKIKRLAAVLLAGVMTLAMVGCGDKATSTSTPASASKTETKKEETKKEETKKEETKTEEKTEEKVKLTMWCIATEGDSNRPAYEQAIEDMKTLYPNVEFEWEAIENETYKTKIAAAMAANEVPDIFFTWSCAFLGDFVSQGKVYCLDDTLKPFIDNGELPENMLGNTTYDGKHYGVPTTMNIVALFANMDLLAEAGWTKVPETYDELIQCCDDLKAKNIIPFGCAGGETWCVTEYLEPIIQKSIGSDALNDIFLGRKSYDNPEVAEAVDLFQSMIDKGYFDPAGAALPNDDVKANFMAGRTAFYQNGTWNCADFAANAEFFPKVKVTEFPVIKSDKSKLGQLIGGPSDTLAVSASSPNAELAAKYAADLGKLICHYGYLLGCGLPAWTPYGDTSNINALTQTVADICAKADSYVLFGDTAMSAVDKQPYLDAVAKVYGKELDGAGFISQLKSTIR